MIVFLLRILWFLICHIILDCLLDIFCIALCRLWVLLKFSGKCFFFFFFNASSESSWVRPQAPCHLLWLRSPFQFSCQGLCYVATGQLQAGLSREPRTGPASYIELGSLFSSSFLSRLSPAVFSPQGPHFCFFRPKGWRSSQSCGCCCLRCRD